MNRQNKTTKPEKRNKKRRYLLLLLLLLILIIVGRCGAERHRVQTDFNKSVAEFGCALDSINSVADIEQVAELLLKLIGYEQYDYVECCPNEYKKRLSDTLIVKGDILIRDGIYAEAATYYNHASEFDNSENVTKRIEVCEGLQTANRLIEEEKFADAQEILANMLADSVVFDDIVKILTDKCADSINLAEAIVRKARETQQKPGFNGYVERAFDTNIEMVFVKGGHFEIVRDVYSDHFKYPFNENISDFYIGRYEITQEQWEKVMGKTLSQQQQLAYTNLKWVDTNYVRQKSSSEFEIGTNYPFVYISWEGAMEFCRRLCQQTGKNYTLPTEFQWQYAATGGIYKEKYKYSGSNNLDDVGWYSKNSGNKLHPIGQKRSNALGLYDMCGNASEWSLRTWRELDSINNVDPIHLDMGGNFKDAENYCLIKGLYLNQKVFRANGFRICMIP